MRRRAVGRGVVGEMWGKVEERRRERIAEGERGGTRAGDVGIFMIQRRYVSDTSVTKCRADYGRQR